MTKIAASILALTLAFSSAVSAGGPVVVQPRINRRPQVGRRRFIKRFAERIEALLPLHDLRSEGWVGQCKPQGFGPLLSFEHPESELGCQGGLFGCEFVSHLGGTPATLASPCESSFWLSRAVFALWLQAPNGSIRRKRRG